MKFMCDYITFILVLDKNIQYMTPRNLNTRVESKNSILFATLAQLFWDKMNLARIKFFVLLICAL